MCRAMSVDRENDLGKNSRHCTERGSMSSVTCFYREAAQLLIKSQNFFGFIFSRVEASQQLDYLQ